MKNTLTIVYGANSVAGVMKGYLNVDQDVAIDRFLRENPHGFGSCEVVEFEDELAFSALTGKILIEAVGRSGWF